MKHAFPPTPRLLALIAAFFALPLGAVEVGDPTAPALLPAALLDAYAKGERDITIAPGTYILPATGKNSIELVSWKDATIHASDVTIIFEELAHRPVWLSRCENVTLEGAILRFAKPSFTQGRITAMGKDAGGGAWLNWQIDAGYSPEVDPSKSMLDVADQTTRLLRVGTGDFGCDSFQTLAPGLLRLCQVRGGIGTAVVGDWVFTRIGGGGSTIVHLDGSSHCTMSKLTLQNAGFAAFFETGGEGGHRYVDCKVAPGPKPQGATEAQLVGCGADGFHSAGTKIGPTIERCAWEGLLHDDCIAIHGSLQKIERVEGNKLIMEAGNRGSFVAGEPVRISGTNGYYGEFLCTAVQNIKEKVEYLEVDLQRHDGRPPVTLTIKKGSAEEFALHENVTISGRQGVFGNFTCKGIKTIVRMEPFLELTLDRESGAPSATKASNPLHNGAGFNIRNCTMGNCRSRAILVKADHGLIEGCTISGAGMSAISIGPEYYWGEADYSRHVIVRGNKLLNNVVNGSSTGVIFVHGEGTIGNADITIQNNRFDKNYGAVAIHVEYTDGVRIAGNRFITSPLRLPDKARTSLSFHSTKNISLKGNVVENADAADTLIKLPENAEGVSGNDETGITKRVP